MTVRAAILSLCLLGISSAAFAQPEAQRPSTPQPPSPRTPGTSTPAAAPPAQPAVPPPPRREGQPVNIKVDVTITDQHSGGAPLKKTVTVVTGDQMSGFIRTQANYTSLGDVPLNIDTEPALIADNKIRLRVNLQYDLPGNMTAQGSESLGAGALRRTAIRENLAVVLENGKPLVVAQSADPVGDRQVTIEVKATILR